MKRPADEEPAQEPVPAAGEYQHTAEYPHPVEYAVAPGAAASTFVCPEEAGQVDHAQLWYYRDHSGQEQGPFSIAARALKSHSALQYIGWEQNTLLLKGLVVQ